MKEHTLTIKTKELLINPIFVIVIFGKVLIHFTTAILLEKIESTLNDLLSSSTVNVSSCVIVQLQLTVFVV